MVTRVRKQTADELVGTLNIIDRYPAHRKIQLFLDSAHNGLSGSVQWHDGVEYVECLVIAGEPFETPGELLTRLLEQQRLQPQLPIEE